jgi:hypothetical protein
MSLSEITGSHIIKVAIIFQNEKLIPMRVDFTVFRRIGNKRFRAKIPFLTCILLKLTNFAKLAEFQKNFKAMLSDAAAPIMKMTLF